MNYITPSLRDQSSVSFFCKFLGLLNIKKLHIIIIIIIITINFWDICCDDTFSQFDFENIYTYEVDTVHKLHVFNVNLGQVEVILETLLWSKNMLRDIMSSSGSNLSSFLLASPLVPTRFHMS